MTAFRWVRPTQPTTPRKVLEVEVVHDPIMNVVYHLVHFTNGESIIDYWPKAGK